MPNKTKNPNLTPKQAAVKVTNLIKGIDNSNIVIEKTQGKIAEAVKQIQVLMPTALTQPTEKPRAAQAAAKPAKAAPAKAVAKPAKAAKPAKPAPAKPAKPAKPAPAKPAKPAVKVNQGERPPLKDAIRETLDGKPLGAAAIYNAVNAKYGEKYGKWSRQSVYNALEKHFESVGKEYKVRQNGDGAASASSGDGAGEPEQDEADRFMKKVEGDQSTAAVV